MVIRNRITYIFYSCVLPLFGSNLSKMGTVNNYVSRLPIKHESLEGWEAKPQRLIRLEGGQYVNHSHNLYQLILLSSGCIVVDLAT